MDKTNKFVNDSNIALPRMHVSLCGCRQITDWSNASPIRPYWRLYWNPESGAIVCDEYKKYSLNKDFILVIPPFVRVKQKLIHPCFSLFIHVDFDVLVKNTVNYLLIIPVSIELEKNIKRLMKTLNNPFIIGEFVFAVISRLQPGIWQHRINDPRIEKVCSLLKSNPGSKWKNRELANRAGFSENAFIRRFREVIGISPQYFLQKLRLEQAMSLLLQNELSIEEIAETCGFCDRYYLTKMFKKHFGQTPGQFRNNGNRP